MRSELFEETLKQHKDSLTDELVQLGKHRQAQLAEWDIEQNESDYEFYFNAGWNAQQSKVDELQRRNRMLNDSIKEQGQKLVYQNEVIETQAEKLLGLRDEKAELQKRVDALELTIKGAVTFVDLQIEATEQGREVAIGTQAKNWWSSKLLMLRPIRRVLEQALKGGLDE